MRPCLFSLLCCVLVLLAGTGTGVLAAPPPEDGIADETRALTEETHRQLAQELQLLRADLRCDVWITASSFAPAGMTVRRQAQSTRQAWSGERPAMLMAYDRATNSSAMSFAPVMWERYPAAELIDIMRHTRLLLTDAKLTLDERFSAAAHFWIDRLRVLESTRLKQTLWLQRSEKRPALILGAVLAGAAVLAALVGLLSRLRDARLGRRFHFPEVHVGTRFGAPYGGGVTSEIATQVGTH